LPVFFKQLFATQRLIIVPNELCFTSLAYFPISTGNEIASFGFFYENRYVVSLYPIVAIDEGDPLAARMGETEIPRGRDSPIGFRENGNPGISRGKLFADIQT
jgi:hypothetical protein